MILVDYRAGSVDLIPLLPPELTKKVTLEAGDVAFTGNGPDGPCTYLIGIEYKSVSDAVSSFVNKRFVGEQFPKMTHAGYKRIYLLIEGEYREGPDGRLQVPSWKGGILNWVSYGWSTTYRQFDNWQNSLTETGKVIVKRSHNRAESAAQTLDLYYMWTKDYDDHKSLFAFDQSQIPPMTDKPSIRRRIFAQIPQIGWELSKRAEEHFATPLDGITAGESQWEQIKGIGKLKAKNIYNTLRKKS